MRKSAKNWCIYGVAFFQHITETLSLLRGKKTYKFFQHFSYLNKYNLFKTLISGFFVNMYSKN